MKHWCIRSVRKSLQNLFSLDITSCVQCGPVRSTLLQRIVYKLCIIIYRCLHQTVPKYFQELCVPVTTTASRGHLRSAAGADLQVLATRTVTFGPRSFAASAPKLWNSLPPALRDSTLILTESSPAGQKLICSA